MARLLVKLHGEEISRITLESGIEYIAGRASDAHIQLANERGISRHHLKFYERDGSWIAESLSKFVLIHVAGQNSEVIEMTEPTVFSVPPYEFYFEPTVEPVSEEPNQGSSENLPAFYNPAVGHNQPVSEDTIAGQRVNNEATTAGVSHLVPYIRISYPNTADDEVLKLEGHLWTAGRDPSCEIFIDSPHVSRKHFELARTNEGFFLTDLGSSNGTKLNGLRTPPHEPTRLDSGDELRVMNIVMLFEIRDTHFANRIESLPVPAFDPMFSALPMPWSSPEMEEATQIRSPKLEEIPSDWRKLRPHHLKHVDWKKNKVRVALLVLTPLLLIMALLPSKPKGPPRDPAAAGQSVVFENLSVEQKAVVKDSFNLARNLYVQGKYELCLTELAKVHELIPQYENSKELQSFCEQGKELVHRQRDLERKERERAMIEQQITGYVEACKARLTVNATVDETRQCLAEAMELDPEHALITEMIHTAQMHEEERKFMKAQKEEEEKKTAKGMAQYHKARNLYKKGHLSKALAAYDDFIETPYPNIENQKAVARREVASIKKELKVKVDTLYAKCKELGGSQKYKEAYLACDAAVKEDPSQNEAKEYRDQMHLELKRGMKNIYEDSVLEESLGNVDSAKEKWRRIMKEDLDFDEYTIKAKSKLQKYGVLD
jgi:pSer/pThr/pTyr-binding forkhead associated (FHA) protein/tetratricopeptide (TPR) repeat protein